MKLNQKEVFVFMKNKPCICVISVIWLILFSTYAFAGDGSEMDSFFVPLMLDSADVPGYQLKKSGSGRDFWEFNWAMAWRDGKKAIVQDWVNPEDKQKRIRYEVCIYDSEVQAHNGILFYINTYTRPSSWGSFSGLIVGDKSWCSDKVLAFIRGNIGVRIIFFNTKEFQDEIVNTFLMKIEQNLSPEIIKANEKLKRTQIKASRYDSLIIDLNDSYLTGFSLVKQTDSKWTTGREDFELVRKEFDTNNPDPWHAIGPFSMHILEMPKADQIVLGRRTEWRNEAGILVYIDICEFATKALALNAAKRRTYEADAYFLDTPVAPEIPQIRWWMYNASIVYVKNNFVVHISQYHPQDRGIIDTHVDFDFLGEAAKKIAEGILNIE